MCGIAGIAALELGAQSPDREALTRMAGVLEHRGPDEAGIYRDARVGLAHTRLSIIDLSTGQQPLANETHRVWIVFNGEIFNYLELREELLALGHEFRTKSDTEVIVHAFEAWGDAALSRMNGQFAIALWDADRATLTLARDRLGVRPLYWCEHQGRLYFGSEIKAIFAADPSIPRRFDPLGLDQTFTFWTVVPPASVFAGIQELSPGSLRTFSLATTGGQRRSSSERPFWSPRYPEDGEVMFQGSHADAAVAVRAALEKATALRMLRADVPVGSYLSGGLDSSVVAALGLRAKGERFHTFSLRFADPEYDETQYQRAMVKSLGSEHHEVVVDKRDIATVFPEVIAYTERPVLRTAPAPLFLLSKLVRSVGIKVVLTGEGADEMFAGYDVFREGSVRRFWGRRPNSTMRPRLLERLYPYLLRSPVAQQQLARQFFGQRLDAWRTPGFAHQMRWTTSSAVKRYFAPDLLATLKGTDSTASLLASLPPEFPRWSYLAQDQYLEIRTLLTGYLLSSQGDRMLMGNSVEGRFPFLDPDVVALADSLPANYKLHGLDEKHVLKRAARGLVPDVILDRKKQPYRAPDALSFVFDGGQEWAHALVSPAKVTAAGVFDPRGATQLWQKCLQKKDEIQLSNTDNMALVGLLSTQLLYEQLVKSCPAPRPVKLTTLCEVD